MSIRFGNVMTGIDKCEAWAQFCQKVPLHKIPLPKIFQIIFTRNFPHEILFWGFSFSPPILSNFFNPRPANGIFFVLHHHVGLHQTTPAASATATQTAPATSTSTDLRGPRGEDGDRRRRQEPSPARRVAFLSDPTAAAHPRSRRLQFRYGHGM